MNGTSSTRARPTCLQRNASVASTRRSRNPRSGRVRTRKRVCLPKRCACIPSASAVRLAQSSTIAERFLLESPANDRKTLGQWSAGKTRQLRFPGVLRRDARRCAVGSRQSAVRTQPRSGGISSRCGSPVGCLAREAAADPSCRGEHPVRLHAPTRRPSMRLRARRWSPSCSFVSCSSQARACSICAPAAFFSEAGALNWHPATWVADWSAGLHRTAPQDLSRFLQPR